MWGVDGCVNVEVKVVVEVVVDVDVDVDIGKEKHVNLDAVCGCWSGS